MIKTFSIYIIAWIWCRVNDEGVLRLAHILIFVPTHANAAYIFLNTVRYPRKLLWSILKTITIYHALIKQFLCDLVFCWHVLHWPDWTILDGYITRRVCDHIKLDLLSSVSVATLSQSGALSLEHDNTPSFVLFDVHNDFRLLEGGRLFPMLYFVYFF